MQGACQQGCSPVQHGYRASAAVGRRMAPPQAPAQRAQRAQRTRESSEATSSSWLLGLKATSWQGTPWRSSGRGASSRPSPVTSLQAAGGRQGSWL